MKVVFFEFALNYGGARRSTIDTVAELRSEFDVSIVDAYGCCDEFRAAAAARDIPFRVANSQKARIVGGFGEGIGRRLWKLACSAPDIVRTKHKAFELFRELQADVIVSNCTKGMAIISGPGKKSWKTVGYMRGWYTPEMLPPYAKYVLVHRLDKILAVSYSTRNALLCSGISGAKIAVIPNAVDVDALSVEADHEPDPVVRFPENELKILIAADCRPAKGQMTAVEALHVLKRKGVAARLYLAGGSGAMGSSSYLVQLKQCARERGVQEQITFLGPRSDIPSLMRRVDVVALPSHTEGMPRTVLEAMALGKPVVSTPVGGVLDLIMPSVTGYLFEVGNSEDMAAQLLKLKDPAMRQILGDCARSYVSREYSPARRRSNLCATLLSLCGKSSPQC